MTESLKIETTKPRIISDVVHGALVGENLDQERDEFEQEHLFMPKADKARLRAATDRALR